MFISMLSTQDGFKLTLPDGEVININLLRTAGINVATIGIDCPKDVKIEKVDSNVPDLERVKVDLLKEIDRLTADYNPLVKGRGIASNKKKATVQYKNKSRQPVHNESKKFPSEY